MTVPPGEPRVYTVSEIQRTVRFHLREHFAGIWVQGEISNLHEASSGHRYFTLKDADAELSAVIWASTVRHLRFEPEEGTAVRARGTLTIYDRRGRYQMDVQALEPVGAGPLQVKFEQMRKRLQQEGLFDAVHKVELPDWPRRVALITSPTGAAVRDLIEVSHRRWPPLELVVVPVKVQGEGAAEDIAAAVRLADTLDFDVLVVGRGGGSLEDRWAFNEEIVARALFAARTPAVSAVGHEVDVSIADLVADLRAPTPSAAAEMVTPSRAEARGALDDRRRRLARALRSTEEALRARLGTIEASPAFRRPLERFRREEQRLDETSEALGRALAEALCGRRRDLTELSRRLDALSPLRVLARGYSVTFKGASVITRASVLEPGDRLRTVLARGEVRSRVEEITPEAGEGPGDPVVK
jgi:exodeoxyribonuclease VII large subunit